MLKDENHEMIAEFISHMALGIDFPVYDGKKRRGLTPKEVSALRALWGIWAPGREPIIRSNGVVHNE